MIQERFIAEQTERLTRVEAFLASPMPTKNAATDKPLATNNIAEASRKLADAP